MQLDHDAVSFFEAVGDLVHIKCDLGGLAGDQRFGFLVAVAEFAAEDFGPDQSLIAGVAAGVREDVDQFDDEVRVGAGG